MTPEQLKQWRRTRHYRSQQALADALGIAWRTVNNYESGATPIPLQFRYALAALDHGLLPFGDAPPRRTPAP